MADKSDDPEKSYKCKDCKVKFPDVYAYTKHLESKEHIKGVMKNKYGEKYLDAKAKLDSKSDETTDSLVSNKPTGSKPKDELPKDKPTESSDASSSSDDEEVFTCEVCKKVCTGVISYRLHIEGKKHQKALRNIKMLAEMKNLNMLPDPAVAPKETLLDKLMPKNQYASQDIVCQLCDKTCTGPDSYKQHCKSKSHMKKMLKTDLLKGIDSLGLTPPPNANDESDSFHCAVCQKGFSGPIPYIQHLESSAHLKQAKQVEERHKMGDQVISKEGSKLTCKECGKTFSGLIPYQAHLKSSVHDKLKKKSALLDSLETQHPELFKASTEHNSDDSDSEAGIVLGCHVCHKAFSGPETAQEHFSSAKHKKALKRKTEFKKFKKQVKLSTVPEVKQKELSASKNADDSTNSDSDEFDIIPNQLVSS